MTIYYRPIPVSDPADLPGALPLAGGWCRFSRVELIRRGDKAETVPAADLPPVMRDRLTAPRAPIAGLGFDRPRLMGILNLTPDSFSDGGAFDSPDAAMRRALSMVAEGAEILDLGGESTRPGAREVPEAVEIARTVPVIAALRAGGLTVPISIDTRKAAVARAALDAGADLVNDVSAFRFDPALAGVAAGARGAVLMHSLGTPETMQQIATYDDALLDVYDALEAAVAAAEAAGLARSRIIVDPGIGFGKRDPHNLALLRRLSLFHALGCPVLLGVSRKGMVGRIAGVEDPAARGPASAALGLWAISQGIQILRVHDIEVHRQMIRLWQAASGTVHEDEVRA